MPDPWLHDDGPQVTPCWADDPDNPGSWCVKFSAKGACCRPGTGRLGLCPKHEAEVLGGR